MILRLEGQYLKLLSGDHNQVSVNFVVINNKIFMNWESQWSIRPLGENVKCIGLITVAVFVKIDYKFKVTACLLQIISNPFTYLKSISGAETVMLPQYWVLFQSINTVSVSSHSCFHDVSFNSAPAANNNNNNNGWQNQVVVLWKNMIIVSCKDGMWWCISCSNSWDTFAFINFLSINMFSIKAVIII